MTLLKSDLRESKAVDWYLAILCIMFFLTALTGFWPLDAQSHQLSFPIY